VAVSAPLGFAQTTLTGTIPFAFAIDAHHVLPAGNYVVIKSGNNWRFRSQETKSVAFVTGHPEESRKTDPSLLVFECRAGRCELRQIQAGQGEVGYYLPPTRVRKVDALELVRIVSVPLAPSAGN
jgi:hypothetical protein